MREREQGKKMRVLGSNIASIFVSVRENRSLCLDVSVCVCPERINDNPKRKG